MRKIFTFLLSTLMVTTLMAQRPEAVIQKAGEVKPVIDGVLDDLWETVEKHNVDKPFGTEVPTLGDEGTTYWKALYDDAGMYIIIVANDDVWYPYTGTGNAWEFDKIELYFDTNYILNDGVGGQGGTSGNRQIAPDPDLTALDGTMKTQTVLGGVVNYAYKVDGTVWTTEWFVPWESIPDGTGALFDKAGTMGFDVNIADNDNDGSNRKRAMWANVGTINENWNNMDDAGHLTFEGAESILISEIVLTGGDAITTDNGTSIITVTIDPVNTTQAIKFKITEGAGLATINKEGVVTAIKDGVVKVKAFSSDDFVESNEITINISGQVVTMNEVSYIKDGNFDLSEGEKASAAWEGGAVIVDGVCTITNPTAGANPWDYTIGQVVKIPEADKGLAFVLTAKLWAAEARIFDLDLELIGGNYERFGDTPDARSSDGKSQWRLDLTTEPTTYTFEITGFPRMDTRAQKFNLFAGMATPTVFVDNVYLVTKADYDLYKNTSVKEISSTEMKVYPNPVGSSNELIVSLASSKVKIGIYNSIGQKLMEKDANGSLVKFNVSSLAKGMYFVRLSDGTSQKFIR
ncbi:MAG: sugar-binding protein [Prolixibacteraceae bacterium]